ncbi:MAG: transposase [Halomonas sp.]|nr:transposase [Halomonas sp.]MCC5901335.1 transposase [Halomonas sp.]
MKTERAFKYRFYPTPDQATLLVRTFGCVRYVWNTVLRYRTDAFYQCQEKIGYNDASAFLTQLKKQPDTAFLAEVSSVPLQQCLRHQQSAFKHFFAKRARYPGFKAKNHRQSATFASSAFSYRDGQITLAKCSEPLNIRWSRDLPSAPSTVTVSKDRAGRYFISCLCQVETETLPITPKMVGIDLGLKDLFVTSGGTKVNNPRHAARYARTLARAQRCLSRKQKGSNNRAKAKQKVAKCHAKISDTRLDHLHKLTRQIVNENQVIAAESLQVKNMVKNRHLSKAISDVAWGELVRQLDYKAEWAGRQFIQIDRWYPSSKRCHDCGYVMALLPLNVRAWDCPGCGTQGIDRDVNAARNILQAGTALLAGAES